MTMDCTKCTSKGCRTSLPCVDRSDQYLEKYLSNDIQNYIKAASELIDNGRAGSLSRIQEIVEYSKLRGYSKVGVAYCYGMEKEAVLLRKYLQGIPGVKAAEDDFIENMPQSFNLVSVDELKSKLASQNSLEGLYLLDLRGHKAFETDGINDSINCLLNDLPKKYKDLMPDKTTEIIAYCNGGIQSIYAVMFLTMKGYTKVKSLSGGFSRFMNS